MGAGYAVRNILIIGEIESYARKPFQKFKNYQSNVSQVGQIIQGLLEYSLLQWFEFVTSQFPMGDAWFFFTASSLPKINTIFNFQLFLLLSLVQGQYAF